VKIVIAIIILLVPVFLFAQENTQSMVDPGKTTYVKKIIIGKIILEGNKITRPHIINRELLLKQGDSLDLNMLDQRLKQSRLNLLNTALFNFVTIDTLSEENGNLNVKIKMIERWYLFPFPIFEIADRNFNSWVNHRDWRRVNYGGFLKWSNLRGRMESLNLLVRFGYDERYRILYDFPYINQKQTIGLTFMAALTQNHEVAYQTIDDKPLYYRGENYTLKYYTYSTTIDYRPSIFYTWLFTLSTNRYKYDSKLSELNSSYAPLLSNSLNFIQSTLLYRNDHRDNKAYPLRGFFTDIELTTQNGLFSNNDSYSNLYIKHNLMFAEKITPRWAWSAGTTFKISSNKKLPYFLDQGLGYKRDYVRGYEDYVIDGGRYVLGRSNIKYNLLKPTVKNLKITGSEKFDKIHYAVYFNIFADMGYVFATDKVTTEPLNSPSLNNNLQNTLLRGFGAGVDFVTYYDKVLRIEYTVNHYGKGGFFIHFETSL
jgi:outer membrane protein assembly factor BamA